MSSRERGIAALLGNGSLLVCLDDRGGLVHACWPHVDRCRHLLELRLGLELDGNVRWLDSDDVVGEQAYLPDTSILRTALHGGDVEAELVDLVCAEAPVLVRHVTSPARDTRLVVRCRPALGGSELGHGSYVDPDTGAIVFYRGGTAVALGLGAEAEARTGRIGCQSGSVAHGRVEGELSIELDGGALLVCALGASPSDALARLRPPLEQGFEQLTEGRRRHDLGRLATTEGGDELVRRSLLVFDLVCDRATGGVIAAPEVDPQMEVSGGYGFVWARDLAYVVLALLAAGRRDLAAGALRWLPTAQAPEGLWLQRHDTAGRLGASWGLHQLDETGAVLFAYESAWRSLHDRALDRELWPSARRAALLLADILDERGLPPETVDLWEEREGSHAYTAAATFGGLRAAAAISKRHEPELADVFAAAAERVRAGIEECFWSDEHERYFRTIPAGEAASGLPYPSAGRPAVEPDDVVDVSLLGLAWPFGAVDPAGERMRLTVAAVERELLQPDGGVLRYAGDTYAGGNRWVLAALWLGLWRRQIRDEQGLAAAVDYAASVSTPLGLLPEQVTAAGDPAWVLPLTWSHAMLVLAARPELELVRAFAGTSSSVRV